MKNPTIISIGGGKGGVGKSTVAANIGAVLHSKGFTIGFIDADLGGANLHLCLGVKRPRTGLQDYLSGSTKNLADVAVKTPFQSSWLISGASDILELANPNFGQKQKIINNLKKLDADYILVDLGAGTDNHVTDFYAAFPYGIVVMDSLPTSVENAYGFLKNGTVRGMMRLFPGNTELQSRIRTFSDPENNRSVATIDELLVSLDKNYKNETDILREWLYGRKIMLVINMVKTGDDIKVGNRFSDIVKKYLSLQLHYVGYVVYSPEIRTSIKQMRPAVLGKDEKIKECFGAITQNVVSLSRGKA